MDQGRISKISAAQRILSCGLILLPLSEDHLSQGHKKKIDICSDLWAWHLDVFLQCFQADDWAIFGPTPKF